MIEYLKHRASVGNFTIKELLYNLRLRFAPGRDCVKCHSDGFVLSLILNL